MSKSAIKYIRDNIKAPAGAAWLAGFINNPEVRKNWRNADVLARFLIDTVANAYQCENSTTFADNGHKDMDDAIESYVEANLCDWDQAKFLASSFGKQTAQEISARLNEWRTKNAEFEQRHQPSADKNGNICLAFRAFWFKGDISDLMKANAAWCRMRDEALEMNRCISANFTITTMSDADRDWCLTARQSWMARRKVVRDAACSYNNAFLAFFHATDYETYTHACIAWLHLMDDALSMNEAWHLAQPCAAARNNAHYYELLVAKRRRQGYVAMTECHLAYQYILNDAIAGDMVKSCDVYRLEILMRDGSWLQLVETMTTDITPHGFYVKTQDKLA